MSLAVIVGLAGIAGLTIIGCLVGWLFGPRRGDGIVGAICGFTLGSFAPVGTLVISVTIALITGDWP